MMRPDLHSYHLVVANSSGGKDSQTMLRQLVGIAVRQGYDHRRIVVVHANLGEAEWPGTQEITERQALAYGLRFIATKRRIGTLLEHIEARGMWPSPTNRYCTSDHKRDQISRVITQLHRESGQRTFRVLNCMGLRAQESPARAKKPVMERNARVSTRTRTVDNWLPIHDWTEEQVWASIRASGVAHHYAYDLGMPRLSCVFCIFAPRPALVLAGKHNPDLLKRYVQLERRMGHTFRVDLTMADVKAAVDAGEETGRMHGLWNMG